MNEFILLLDAWPVPSAITEALLVVVGITGQIVQYHWCQSGRSPGGTPLSTSFE